MEVTPERQFAEEVGLMMAGLGMPPAYGKLLGYLLICDPPHRTGTELATALGLSKGSVSAGLKMLEATKLIRRVATPGQRGAAYEMAPDAMVDAAATDTYRLFRELLDRGVALAGGEDTPRTARLRYTRDFYALIEGEIPQIIARFKRDHPTREGDHDG